jgi:hypothetical protein
MAFDIEGARRAGYSDAEIADHMAKQSGFDAAGAKQAGYTDADILQHLTASAPTQPAPQDDRSYVRSAAEGVLRSAASVGNTILSPVRAAANYLAPEETTVQTLVDGKKRRTGALAPVANYLNEMRDSMDWLDRENASNPMTYGAGRLVGDIAMTAPVGGFVGAGIKAAGARAGLPVVERLGTAVATGGLRTGAVPTTVSSGAANLGVRAAGGAINGGVSAGLIDPDQAGAGALVGAAFPVGMATAVKGLGLAGQAVSKTRQALAPLNPKNDARLVGQFLRDQAGPEADTAVKALKTFQQTGPALPGYQATAAEVARVPSFAALQRTATAVDPLAMNEYSGMATRNQDLLVNQLEDLAGRDGQRAFTDAMREETANRLYQQAYSKPIDPAQLTKPMQRQIDNLMQKPAMQEAMRRARVLGQNEGLDIADEAGSLRGLHYAKTELDSMIRDAATRNEKRILQGVQFDLLKVMDQLSPDYGKARSEYAAMSVPVNQFDVLEQIAANSITPRGTVTLNKFNRAATDKTAKVVLKRQDATLPSLLTPEQLNTLGGVRSSLEGLDFVQNAGRGVGSDTVQKLATANRMPGGSPGAFARLLPGVTGTLGGILSQGANAVYSGANRRLQERLTRGLLDPVEALNLLEAAQPAGVSPVMGLLGQARKQGEKALPLAYRTAPLLLTQ